MSTRQPLPPVTGLKRTSSLPPPPPRTSRRNQDASNVPLTASATARSTAQPDAPTVAAIDQQEGPPPTSADTIRAISLSLPLPLVEALKSRARAERITHAEVLMDAVTSQRTNLTELVKNTKPRTQTDALFTRRHRAGDAPIHMALSLRMMSSNVTALNELTQHHAADSRSQLCAAALTGYITP